MWSWKVTTSKRLLKSLNSSLLELSEKDRTEIVPRKPACQMKSRHPQVYVGSGNRTGYFIFQPWVLVTKQSSLCWGSSLNSFVMIYRLNASSDVSSMWTVVPCVLLYQFPPCCLDIKREERSSFASYIARDYHMVSEVNQKPRKHGFKRHWMPSYAVGRRQPETKLAAFQATRRANVYTTS